jgi:sugar fermentation stimulation protein A
MKWSGPPLVEGVFVEGRLRELLFPGARVALVDHSARLSAPPKSPRKTRYAIRLAHYREKWVCIEANIAPKLLEEAWRQGRIPCLKPYDQWKAEVPLNAHTRFDFRGINSRTGERAWVEVKCVTLVGEGGLGYFPDAPSERASKHLRELMALAKKPKTRCFV